MKVLLSTLLVLLFTAACSHKDWRTADNSSSGLAPLPEKEKQAIVHIYAARAFNWRGYFAVHTWIATKEKDADQYTSYHVMGYEIKYTGSAVVIRNDIPDRKWYGAMPYLVYELKGEKAEQAIPKIHAAALKYPYKSTYTAWPGPNSNTFISYILRNTPEIGVELPPHAIGKDYLSKNQFAAISESKTGAQLSAYGLLGLTVGLGDGIELNILGMSFGLDIWRPALKLPFVGRLGFEDAPVFD